MWKHGLKKQAHNHMYTITTLHIIRRVEVVGERFYFATSTVGNFTSVTFKVKSPDNESQKNRLASSVMVLQFTPLQSRKLFQVESM